MFPPLGMEVRLAENVLREANANVAVAKTAWLPNLALAPAIWHHDGLFRIFPARSLTRQNAVFAGPLLRLNLDPATAARESQGQQLVRVREAQLHREARQHFHDAAMAYIDLQSAPGRHCHLRGSAHTGRRHRLSCTEVPRRRLDLLTASSTLHSRKEQQRIGLMKLKQDHLAAGAKLADLLDVELRASCTRLAKPATMLKLVDVNLSEQQLVATALSQGPGTVEVEFAMQSLQEELDAARRNRFTPQLGVDLGYGAFGGGVGGNYRTWGDRTDVGVHVYSGSFRTPPRRRQSMSLRNQKQQVNLQRQQLQTAVARRSRRTAASSIGSRPSHHGRTTDFRRH